MRLTFMCAQNINKKKFTPPKQNVGRGGGGYFVKIYQKRIKYMLKIENCEQEVEKRGNLKWLINENEYQ